MTQQEIEAKDALCRSQGYYVVKSNYLIQKSKYQLSAQEQKMVLFMISKIKPDDEDLKLYDFDLKDLCAVCGITYNGKNYRNFKASIEGLANKSFWLDTGKDEILCRWVRKAVIHKRGTMVSIGFDEDLKPFLLKLKNNFTVYELNNVLVMDGKYSIRLYEILKSYAYKGYYEVSIEDLRATLQITGYKEWQNFKVRVIEPAIEEINRDTDLDVSYTAQRAGRGISSLTFKIQKKPFREDALAMLRRGQILNGETPWTLPQDDFEG